ncbi:MAG: hypothetical protein DLM71_05575 [Chloroflexi bacterium]|nr:MAG: hypothetical protein DLM71_05575 [Chloroflexota bacterium]
MTNLSLLSPAERRVLDEAALGLTVREIAERLVLTPATVKTHLAHIYSKLEVRGRVDLLARLRQDRRDPSAGEGLPGGPRRRLPWMMRTLQTLLVLLIVALFAGTLLTVATRPTSATLEDVQRMLDRGSVTALRLEGSTLHATTDSGSYEVLGVHSDQIRPRAMERSVAYSEVEAPGIESPLLILWSLTPYMVMAVLVGFILALIRRHTAGPRLATAT